MERRDEAVDVGCAGETLHRQRHLDLPHLIGVARFDCQFDAAILQAGGGDEFLAAPAQRT